MRKELLFVLFLFLGYYVFGQEQNTKDIKKARIINVNPDPNGEPWIAGGVRELSQEEKAKQLALPRLKVKRSKAGLPSKINNAENPAFRPIFNQVGNCCAQASGVAYHFTYEMNLLWGTAADAPEHQFPSHYTWNFLNGGLDYGSWYFDGWDIIKDNGCPTIAEFGSIDANGDHTYWMSGYDKYLKSMKNTIIEYKTIQLRTAQGISDLKQWMYDHARGDAHGGLANFSALSSGYTIEKLPEGTEDAGKSVLTSWGTDGAHAMTFVGYNDNVCWDYNGDGQYTNDIDINNDGVVNVKDWEKGAFILANSWGNTWEDNGFCYYMYRMCAYTEDEGGLQNNQLVHIINVTEKSKIDLTLKVKMRHSNRGALNFKVGINPNPNATAPSQSRDLEIFNNMGGEHAMNGLSVAGNTEFEFGIDISDFASQIVNEKARVFLEIYSEDGTGELISSSVIDYRTVETEHKSIYSGEIIKDGSNNFIIDITPAGTSKLFLSSALFSEKNENDGSLSSCQINLENARFAKTSGDLVLGTDYQLANVPAGLTAKLEVLDETTAQLSLTGNAVAHEKINNKSLQLIFNDAAFNAHAASDIIGTSRDIEISFKNEYTTEYIYFDDVEANDQNTFKYFSLGEGNGDYGVWRFKNATYPELKFKLESYNKDVVCYEGTNNIIPLNYGDEISTTSPWYAYTDYPDQQDIYSTDFTEWAGKQAYIGIKITAYEGVYHGWMTASIAADGSSFKVIDAAYYTKPEGSIAAGKANEPMLKFEGDTIYEDVVNNNGSLENSLTAKLLNCNFTLSANTILQKGVHYSITGLPTGISEEIKILDNNYISIRLKGFAENHNKSDLTNINVQFTNALFNGLTVDEIKNAKSLDVAIKFIDDYKIIYKDITDVVCDAGNSWDNFYMGLNYDYAFGTWLNEGLLRLETYGRAVVGYKGTLHAKPLTKGTTIQMSSEWAQAGDFPNLIYLTDADFTEWYGVEAYVGCVVEKDGYPCYGWIRIEVGADGKSFTVKDWAYNEQPYSPIIAGETSIVKTVSIGVSNGEFIEPYANDGSLEGTAYIGIINDEFAFEKGTVLTQGTHYTVNNLPEGLRCQLTIENDNSIKLNILGNAKKHTTAENKEFTISLKDNVFAVSTASTVENSTFGVNITFKEPWEIIYTNINDITVSKLNVWSSFNIGMGADNFGAWWYNKNGQMKIETYGNYVLCQNGTMNLKPLNEGDIIGNNSNEWYQGLDYPNEPDLDNNNYHAWLGKEAYMGVSVLNGDLWHYGWIRIAVAADGQSYTVLDFAYNDQPGAPIMAGQKVASDKAIVDASKSIFMEAYSNDGSISGENYISICNGKFNTENSQLILNTQYEVKNLPEGLQVQLSVINSDSLKLTISGKATQHETANNSDFSIVLKESAFNSLSLDNIILGNLEFTLNFRDAYKVVYVDCDDITCSADYKWTRLDILPNLDGVGAFLYNWDYFKLETYGNKAICIPGTSNIKFLGQDVLIDKNTIGWTDYDEYPNLLEVYGKNYTDNKGKEGYVGLQIEDNGFYFYAWLRISVAADGKSYQILDYAYNEEPNKAIFTGSKVFIPVKPNVDFTADKLQIFQSETVAFSDISLYEPFEWNWDFQGGQPEISTEQNPTVNYTQQGVYDVSLTAVNVDGSSSLTKSSYITIFEEGPAIAAFTSDKVIVKTGDAVNFSDASLRIPTSWEWVFEGGNPTSSTEQNPVVTYNTPGTYSVKLLAKNSYGLSQEIKEAYITVQNNSGYCTATSSSVDSYTIITGVSLNDLVHNSGKELTTYSDFTDYTANVTQSENYEMTVALNNEWSTMGLGAWIDWNQDKDFDDAGEQIFAAFDNGTSATFTVSIPADAAVGYTRMRVRTKSYDAAKACGNFSGSETEDYTVSVSAPALPKANFIADKKVIAKGSKVLFTDMSENNPDTWAWEFEGAVVTSSDKPSLYVTYPDAGTFRVALTVTKDGVDNTKTVESCITVTETEETPEPAFIAEKTLVNSGGEVRFFNTTQYNPNATYAWSFEGGNPATSSELNPTVSYYYQGAYSVSLSVTTPAGPKNLTKNALIKVNEVHKPVADFTANKTVILNGSQIQFTDLSGNEPESWAWEFEGGTPATSTSQNPVITYSGAGTYKVKLTATNSLGSGILEKLAYITVNEFIPTGYCAASNVYTGNWLEIRNVTLGDIDNTSGLTEYSNFTSLNTDLNRNDSYNMSVSFGNGWPSNSLFVWIDWNQDKTFDAGERVFFGRDTDGSSTENFQITVPANATEGYTVMRLRTAYSPTCDPCGTLAAVGEVEDYTIHVTNNSAVPSVNFIASNVEVEKGKSVLFTDKSGANAISWEWTFNGGTPSTSDQQNPVVVYNTAGSYDVSLEVTYASGSKLVTKTAYIVVTEPISNHAPLGITLSHNEIDENSALGTQIGLFTAVDEDNSDTHTFSLVAGNGINDLDNASFTMNGNSLELNTSLDFETKSSYAIYVKVEDAAGKTYSKSFTIKVKDVYENMAPTNIILSALQIDENQPTGTEMAVISATDPDVADTHTFELLDADGIIDAENNLFTIAGNKLKTAASFDYETKSELHINIKANDGVGNSFTKAFVITVNDVFENNAPTAISLSNSSITENAEAGILFANISATDADQGDSFTYELVDEAGKNSADNNKFNVSGSELLTNEVFDYETTQELHICLKVTDSHGGTFVQEFTLNVLDVNENQKPTDIQLSKYVVESSTTIGSIVADLIVVDNDISDTHTFRLYPSNGIQDADNGKFVIEGSELKLNSDISAITGKLNIFVKVTDQSGAIFSKALQIEVVAEITNEAPTALYISNNEVSDGETVGFVIAQISVDDADVNDSHVFSLDNLISYPDNASFTIQSNKLKLNKDLSYKLKKSYTIQLKATDLAGSSVSEVFVITVIPAKVNEKPSGLTLSNNSIAENSTIGTIIGSFTAIDADSDDSHTFEFVSGGIDNNAFTIEGNNLKLNASLDFETKASYSIKVKVTDLEGESFIKTLSIEITNINEAPSNLELSNNSIAENAAIGTVIGNLSAIDPDANDSHTFTFANGGADNASFTIDGTNLKLNTALDFETKASYSIKVKVSDAANASFEKELGINVTDIDENNAPTNIILSNNSVAENAALETIIGELSATDTDAGDIHTFTFADGGTDNTSFTIDGTSLKLNTALDFETKASYSIKVKVTDAANASFEKELGINVTDVDENNAPTNIILSNNSVAEDAALETIIGEFSATDTDAGDTHTFTFADGGADNASFTIDGTNLKLNTALDFETKASYSIKVKVTDAAGSSFDKEFTIQVSQVLSTISDAEIECKLYPNPMVDALNIKCAKIKNVKLYDAIGNLLISKDYQYPVSEVKLNVSNIPQGVCLIRIELENKNVIIKKVIK